VRSGFGMRSREPGIRFLNVKNGCSKEEAFLSTEAKKHYPRRDPLEVLPDPIGESLQQLADQCIKSYKSPPGAAGFYLFQPHVLQSLYLPKEVMDGASDLLELRYKPAIRVRENSCRQGLCEILYRAQTESR